ncbi:hypothetical protein SAMN05421738_11511 [Algoriella xinjiangensis]|uniref:Uncharacterized protein n=1 Tax=Algoriella xinjiangensis TaxID=684065 RepID=A0A1I5A0W2_9FLAO|nr:hypothetical protein [Algoriella xinjiangensis]SFN55909.1 hypothetical protein SAMN05421738_11511 [Algoriella xinjiangensis]VDH16386.1 Uncharacterised protein [Algoriella xinjiangensis]
MKYINYFVYLTIFLVIIVGAIFYFSLKTEVGNINKRDIIDQNTAFEPCSSDIYQYYNDKTGYKTERFGIRNEISQSINNLNYPNFSGLINVRFVINCKNEIGYFRIKTTNQHYKNIEIPASLQKQIVAIIQQLKNWNGKNKDSYYQIYIKIRNGKVEDIF